MVLYPVIDDGQATYYEYETTLSGSGGLPPDWENSSERHSITLTEIYRWSDYEGVWHIDNQFATAQSPFGSTYPPPAEVDVERGYKRKSSFTATARNGSTLQAPDSRPPLDLIPEGSAPSSNRVALTPLFQLSADTEAPAAARNAPTFTAAERRAARADQMIVTPRGAARALDRLNAQFAAAPESTSGGLEFRKREKDRELRVNFNPAIGAVTRTTVLKDRKKQIETRRRYRREGEGSDKVWVLTSIETTMFDENGKRQNEFVQEIGKIQVQQSGGDHE